MDATDPPRRRLSAAARRDQIVRVVLELIAQEGAARLTAVRIGRAMGISDAALFKHFPNMAAIVRAAIDAFGALLQGSLERPEARPVERLRAFFLHRLHLVQRHPEVLRLAFDERLADAADVQGAALVRGHVDRSRGFILECLRQGRDAGEIRADVSASGLLWTVTGHMRGAALAHPPDATPPRAQAVWDDLFTLLRAPTGGPPSKEGAS